MDSLRVLDTDPVDYLVTPRVLASMIAGPILNVLCFCMGKHLRQSIPMLTWMSGLLVHAATFCNNERIIHTALTL